MVEYNGEALLPCVRLQWHLLKTSKSSLVTKCGVAIHALHVHQTECWSENLPVFDEQTVTRDALKHRSPYFSISKMKPSFLLSWGQTEGGQREITLPWMRHLHTSPTFALHNSFSVFVPSHWHPWSLPHLTANQKGWEAEACPEVARSRVSFTVIAKFCDLNSERVLLLLHDYMD